MEGSSAAKGRELIRQDHVEYLRRAGLPVKSAAAWTKARPRVSGNFKRDAAMATKYWRGGADLLAKLPKKPARTIDQQGAVDLILHETRRTREDFLLRHADAVYRKLTKNLQNFERVDDLCYDAAKLVPGLVPTRQR